jgi:hypothetical protein
MAVPPIMLAGCAGMEAGTLVTAGFAVIFAVIWLAVAGTTIAHYLRPGDERPDISVLARAGLPIWASGVLVFFAASWRHWPPSRMSQMQFLETCKTTGSR